MKTPAVLLAGSLQILAPRPVQSDRLCVFNDDEFPFLPISGGRRKPVGFQ